MLHAASANAAEQNCTPDSNFNSCIRITHSGAVQTFNVPAGVTSLDVRIWGAGGGGAATTEEGFASGLGGGGGFATGTLAVTPGQTLTMVVGSPGVARGGNRRFGGGGAGGRITVAGQNFHGSSGGGRSGIHDGASNTELITAGGGGGSAGATINSAETANAQSLAGAGGQDADWVLGCVAGTAATAGTQSAGGAGGSGTRAGATGVAFVGGSGGSSANSGTGGGGGGGGGHYGGGGGAGQRSPAVCAAGSHPDGQEGGGAGGSNFLSTSISDGTTLAGNRQNPANPTDSQYVDGIARGGERAGNGGEGLIVVQFNLPIRLRLLKSLPQGRVQPSDQFNLDIADANGSVASATTTGNSNTPSESADFNTTLSATYMLSETAVAGATLGNYASSISCSNAISGSPTVLPSGRGNSFQVTPTAGDDIICTFANTPSPADLQVSKSGSPNPVASGELVTWTIVVSNVGQTDVNNAVLSDSAGTGQDCGIPGTDASCTVSGGASCPARVPVADLLGAGISLPRMPTGSSVTLSFQCLVTATGN